MEVVNSFTARVLGPGYCSWDRRRAAEEAQGGRIVMSQDYEIEILARARIRQHREAARRLANIAQVLQAGRGRPDGLGGFSLANLVRLLRARARTLAGRQRPVTEGR
jgi:CRISPR/Cas system endoribonuclease Cas6 (RAMP superfamily)